MRHTFRRRASTVARKSVSIRIALPGPIIALLAAFLCIAGVGLLEAASLSGEGVRGSRIRDLIKDVDRNCVPIVEQVPLPGSSPMSRAQLNLRKSLETIRKSEIGAWLTKVAADQQVLVCLDHTTGLEAHYRFHLQLIGLSNRLNPAGRIVFLAHELAHVPQHPRFSNNRLFSPGDMLLLQRMREATAEAVATRVLWQLRDQGIVRPWQEKLTTAYRDIAISFEEEMIKSRNHDQELSATRTAFHQWFKASWRLEIYDKLMTNTLSRISINSIDTESASLHLSEEYLLGIDNYAGQSFLRDGDNHILIRKFHHHRLPAKARRNFDEMTARIENSTMETVPMSVSDDALSAIVPNIVPR